MLESFELSLQHGICVCSNGIIRWVDSHSSSMDIPGRWKRCVWEMCLRLGWSTIHFCGRYSEHVGLLADSALLCGLGKKGRPVFT
jgi:hypothetical protein